MVKIKEIPMRRFIPLLACAALLCGCSALDLKRAVPSEELAKTRHIGVVSTFDDVFRARSLGLTVFNNDSFEAPIPDWQVAQFATAKTVELIKRGGRFDAKALDLGGVNVAALDRGERVARLLDAARRQGDDTLLVIRPGVSDNYLMFPPGYGLFQRFSSRCVYAGYVVNAYNVATGQSIGWEWGGESPCTPGSARDIPFKKQFADYAPEERQLIRERLEARISDTLGYALDKLALAPVR